MAKPIPDDVLQERLQALHAAGDNTAAAARILGIPRTTMQSTIEFAKKKGIVRERNGKLEALDTIEFPLPPKGEVWRYLITSAQDYTDVNPTLWANLQALAVHLDAELMVAGFTYNKEAFGNKEKQKRVKDDAERAGGKYSTIAKRGKERFDPAVREYLIEDRIDLAPRLTFCAELNIMPTARKPLSGLESYTYRKSTIVPHPKLELKSVPGMKSEGVKMLYTTGCCTMRNYIQRKEGFRAEHFHAYAGLLVEVNDKGQWWVRQVEQGTDGTLCDLTLVFKNGKLVTNKGRVANICWGDLHASKLDAATAEAGWLGEGNMLDVLRPYSQHIHDLLDASPFGHHTRKDPFEDYRAYMRNDRRSIATELRTTAQVGAGMQRPWCRGVVVNANHDRHLARALAEIDWRKDAENAELLCRLTADMLRAIRTDDKEFYVVEHALRMFAPSELTLEFLREDASDVILRHIDGGIECGLHGDRGANGARGTPGGIAKAARKINMADKHTAEITDHVYVAGVSGKLDMGYNKGLSSWTHAHIVTYNNGCRTIMSVYDGQWRA